MDNKIRFVSLGEIQDALQSGDWSKILGQSQNGECACGGNCACHNEKQATVEPKVNDTKVNQAKGQAVGSIFSLDMEELIFERDLKEIFNNIFSDFVTGINFLFTNENIESKNNRYHL